MRLIDTQGLDEEIRCEMCRNPMHTDRGCDGNCKYDEILYEKIIQILNKRITPLPSAQPEKRTEKRTETHACDLISRQAAIDAIVAQTIGYTVDEIKAECEENIFNENGYLGGLKDAIEAIEDEFGKENR